MTTTNGNTCEGVQTPEGFLTLLGREAAMYAKLESYASKQRGLITREDTGPLLTLLADRQRISTELAQIGATLGPIRKRWETYRTGLSDTHRAEAERLFGETARRLGHIMEVDEQDARMLQARKQVTAQSLRARHSAGVALSAYDGPHGAGGRRLDEAM